MRIFCYELVCAGGLGPNPPESLRAEGWAMLSAVTGDLARIAEVEVSVLLSDDCPALPGVHRLPSSPHEESDRFADAVAAHDATLVIAPECGGLLAQRNAIVLSAGRQLIGCRPDAVGLTADKLALASHWFDRGVPTLQTRLATEALPALPFPCVVKPRHGAGSQATQLVAHSEDWARAWTMVRAEMLDDDFIVQPFQAGKACSIAFLVGPQQRVALAATEQLLSQDGTFHYLGGRIPLSTDESERARRLGHLSLEGINGLGGYVGVDLVLGDAHGGRDDRVIEINPRLTTSYIGLRQFTSSNLAEAMVRVLHSRPISAFQWHSRAIRFEPHDAIDPRSRFF